MKQNIVIVFLIAIIIILLYMIFHPSVVTQRKTFEPKLAQKTANELLSEQENYTQLHNQKNIQSEPLSKSEFKTHEPYFWSETKADTQTHIRQNETPKRQTDYNIQVRSIDIPKEQNISLISQTPVPVTTRRKSLGNNLSVCEPYKETLISEYMGMKMKYDIEIVGWLNNKCILNFQSSMLDAGDAFEKTYGFEPGTVDVVGFSPKVRCEFTSKQLLSVSDSFLLEERNPDRKMLKDPNRIEFPELKDMTFSDIKLLKILLSDRACKIINANDFVEMFQSLFMF